MTRQLETENQRMEQRLNELKMAIRRDREERGQAGFWSKGQQGSLGNYATEVLSQPSSAKSERQSSGKKKKVKVLKDEPIAKSARKVQPGTYGNISMRDAHPPSKIKGPKCGQCEQKAAHVSCHECGEDYCAACFAAFHLKGALRRHRSLPVGSNGGLTARSSSRSSFIDGSGASGDIPPRSQRALYSDADLSVLPAAGRTPSPPANGFSGPSLLDGTYDESEAQASFQQALAEWRHGKATPREHKNNFQTSGASSSRQQKEIKPKAVSVESGTSTDSPQVKKPLEITFTTKSDLTYAEKLLLKKLRREQQGQTTPRQIEDASCSSLNGARPHFDDHDAPFFDDAALDAEVQRVSFTALANAVREPSEAGIEEEAEEEEEEERPESHVSILEIKKSQLRESLKGLEQSAQYQVSEVPDDFVRRSQPKFSGPTTKDAFMTPSPPSSAKRRSPTTRRLVRSPQLPTQTPVVHFSARSVPSSPVSDIVKTRTSPRSHSGTTPRKRSTWVKNSQENLNLMASSEDPLKKKNRPPSRPGTKVKKGASLSKQKTSLKDMTGDVPLDLSLEGHPLETCRTERSSAQGQRSQSRNGSRAGSASSRAGSRPSSSRTKSRVSLASIFGEGTLTKTPSSSLKEVADLAGKIKVPRYTPVVGDFLVAGVRLPQEERVLTPSGKRSRVSSARNEKWKISYKLYDLGPRSWRPESSLDIAVDHVEALDIPRYYGSRHPDPEVEKESKVAYSLQDPRRTVLTSQDEVVLDLDTPRSTTLNLTPRSAFHETPRSVTFREDSTQRSGSATFRVKRPGTPGKSRETTPRDNEAPPVVVDGEDMSKFDDDRVSSRQEEEAADNDALNQLEWELASETGRIDADGNISRMSTRISEPDQLSSDGENKTPEAQFDFNNQLRASVLMDDFEEMEQRLMEEEVKALQ